MLVSWNWLQEYVALDMPLAELENRLMMAGLNHEGTERTDRDVVIDLEVTSNRPDCLGHIGVAREIAVLWQRDLTLPAAAPAEGSVPAGELTAVEVTAPELCSRYTARIVRGVQIGPSPPWLADRLRAVGIAAINNVVDATNYVLMECGQPLHAFDFAKVAGRRIVVRRADAGETFEAIDHRTYTLAPGMCVIADAAKPVALAGVMGGAKTEVSASTTELLIESACFDPVSVRTTARALRLHSPSSYRFERGVDPDRIDWASRRCCELILELAGGQLACGLVDAGSAPPRRGRIVLRLSQLQRILGISIDAATVRSILAALGIDQLRADDATVEVVPPSWRSDLSREIDLVEEVARIHGYEKIPEDTRVAMTASQRRRKDRIVDRVGQVLTAAGFHEAMTLSAVDARLAELRSPWSDAKALRCTPAVLRGCDRLRQSLVPSLLAARRSNESLANEPIELFELARVYLPQEGDALREEELLALSSGRDFLAVKGVVEALAKALGPDVVLETAAIDHELLDSDRACGLVAGGRLVGYLGQLSAAGRDRFDLVRPSTVAELRLAYLLEAAQLVPHHSALSPYPAVTRDRNVVFDQLVRWIDVERIVRAVAGDLLEEIRYQETYRSAERLGAGKKSLVFRMTLRSRSGTLTGERADELCRQIDDRLGRELGGELRREG